MLAPPAASWKDRLDDLVAELDALIEEDPELLLDADRLADNIEFVAERFPWDAALRATASNTPAWYQCEVVDGTAIAALLEYDVELRAGWHPYVCRELIA